MDREKRQEAVFGAWDGVVSITGFIFGLLIHHSPESAIAIGGLGGAIAAAISMATGEIEKGDGPWRARVPIALTMFVASLIGSLTPIWPFFIFSKSVALLVAGIGCFGVATVIGFEKSRGIMGYVSTYIVLLVVAGITFLVISAIPGSG